jgi:hypothetical protein
MIMTHQPPIPDAATSPYPLHPEPISEEQKQAAAQAEALAREEAEAGTGSLFEGGVSATALGVGAAIGIGAAAAVTGLLYARKRSRKSEPRRKSGGDDKRQRGAGDRSRVAAGEPYEVSYFARKHKISAAEARAIIKEAGPSRDAANALAARRKQKG